MVVVVCNLEKTRIRREQVMKRETIFVKAKRIAARYITEKPVRGAIAPDYDWNAYHKGNLIQKWWKRKIARHVMEMAGDDNPIVDLGCGSSPILSMMKAKEKVGVDVNPGKIEYTRKKDSTSKYITRLAEDSNLPENYYGVTLCGRGLYPKNI